MSNVHPIRLGDPVDTAQRFADELGNADRRAGRRWTAKCFGRSRFRRAAIYDGLAVTLLMALMACLGVVLFAASAKADGYLDDDELVFSELHGQSICDVITEYYGLSGVLGVHQAIMDEGFTADSAVDVLNFSVHEFCPDNWRLLVAIGRAARAGA